MVQATFDYEAGQAAKEQGLALSTLNEIVLDLMQRARVWYMPFELVRALKIDYDILISDSSLTARLRDLRKPQYGSHIIEKRRREGSTAYEYRLNDRREA